MLAKRIIPCLDIDKGRVVKGVNFVNLVDAGDPVEVARAYDKIGADEIVFLDITASSDGRKTACVVLAVDAKANARGGWDVYLNGGRVNTGLDALTWIRIAEKLGAGEVLLTSMDRDGTKSGYDIELTRQAAEAVNIPVIASGGAGCKEHFAEVLTEGKADAALAASLFHFAELDMRELKNYLAERGIPVRKV